LIEGLGLGTIVGGGAGLCRIVFATTLCPEGAFGVRQLAAAFENSPMCLLFKVLPESGSKLPHSEGVAGSGTREQQPEPSPQTGYQA
jgi:hypothetical protein